MRVNPSALAVSCTCLWLPGSPAAGAAEYLLLQRTLLFQEAVDVHPAIADHDPVAGLGWLFLGGAPPAYPGRPERAYGLDTDAEGSRGSLGCSSYPPCNQP